MASELGWVGLGVSPDFTGFKGKVDHETSKVMSAAGVSGGSAFGESAGRSAGAKFKSAIKSAAKIGAAGLAAAGYAAFKFGGDALEEAREAQKVGALTASTIKATGGAAKVTAKHVADLSGAISEKVGIDDEAIQSGANMLLTFKNIRNETGEGNKVFDQTLGTLVDLSAAMGTDAKSSAIQLGKALNDPVKGITALTRVGVTFTDEQKKQIEQFVKHGDALKAQKVILRELNSEFKGAAKSQADSGDKLTVAWGNFEEEVGNELLPVMDDLARFLTKKGIPKAREFFGWIKDTGVPAIKDLKEDLEPAAGHLKDFVGYLNDLPKSVKIGGLAGILGLVGAAKLRGGKGGLLGTTGSLLGAAKPVPVFVTNAGGLGAGAPGTGGAKPTSTARNVGRAILPLAVADAAYETTAGDLYGLDKNHAQSPQTAAGGVAFGIGLKPEIVHTKEEVDKLVDSTNRFKGALDLVGAKKVNPDLRIPNILNEQNRLSSLDSVLDLVGSKKVRPHVEVQGIDTARAKVQSLQAGLDTLAAFDPTGLAGLAAVGNSLGRNRRRNLGGMP